MDRYYKTPVLYRNMGIEMFCNFIEDSKEATFLELIYGDEAKTNSYDSKEIRNKKYPYYFSFLYS
jgi:hypothetical protein